MTLMNKRQLLVALAAFGANPLKPGSNPKCR